jgi:hypothetical protein
VDYVPGVLSMLAAKIHFIVDEIFRFERGPAAIHSGTSHQSF